MTTWKFVGEQVTSERRVRVENESGESGYVNIVWSRGRPVMQGSVYKITRFFDDAGVEFSPEERVIIDPNPKFE